MLRKSYNSVLHMSHEKASIRPYIFQYMTIPIKKHQRFYCKIFVLLTIVITICNEIFSSPLKFFQTKN